MEMRKDARFRGSLGWLLRECGQPGEVVGSQGTSNFLIANSALKFTSNKSGCQLSHVSRYIQCLPKFQREK